MHHPSICNRLLALFLCSLALGLTLGPTPVAASSAANGSDAGEMEITFHLVPAAHFGQATRSRAAMLPEGTIRLFRAGHYVEEITAEANLPVRVPRGVWSWIAQAPGYVSISSSALIVHQGRSTRQLVWKVVPACEVVLSASDRWRGVRRVDVVSIDHGSVYPIVLEAHHRTPVPAGRFLLYTVEDHGLGAVSEIRTCRQSETIMAGPPPAPPSDRQTWMIHADLASGEAIDLPPASVMALEARLELRSDGRRIAPTAIARSAAFATVIFLNAPAAPAKLTLRHPARMRITRDLPADGGRAHERSYRLPGRVALEVPIDYRPARGHARALLRLERCGDDPADFVMGLGGCVAVAEAQPLRPGQSTYRFDQLDRGQYLPVAEIDDEALRGLVDHVAPFLDDGEAVTVTPLQELVEHHIFGHLTRDAQPVPGEVRITNMGRPEGTRTFPTGDRLLYHIYYFGMRDGYDLDPVRRRAKEVGLPALSMLQACDHEGCRSFHHRAAFRGSGRFDIALDDGARLDLLVRDARTGEPIASAKVLQRHVEGEQPVLFENGHLLAVAEDDTSTRSAEGLLLETDREGRAVFLALRPGERRYSVTKDGYTGDAGRITLTTGTATRLAIELEPLTASGGLRLRLSDGRIAARALLLTFAPSGEPDYPCLALSNALSEVEVPEPCLADRDRPWLAFHADAFMRQLDAASLEQAIDIELTVRTSPPLRIRVRDGAGLPVAGASIALRFPAYTLAPDHLLAIARSGLPASHVSDAGGSVTLPFLDPRGVLPALLVGDRPVAIAPSPGAPFFEAVVPSFTAGGERARR